MRISCVVLMLVGVKLVYLSTRPYVFPLVWILCGMQLFIRILALYFVRESIDDLKREIFLSRKTLSSTKSLVSQSNNTNTTNTDKGNETAVEVEIEESESS